MSDEATIRRGARNARYTTVPNHVFEDARLSMEARWLLGYLLSKPDNWTVRMGDIANKGGCGRDKARRMVNELVDIGYAEKEQPREDGRFSKLCLVIFDEPKAQRDAGESQGVASLPQTENPSTVNPSPENPSTGNAALVKTESLAIPESSFERERAREDEKAVERWLKKTHPGWPSFVSDSMPKALAAARGLTAEERETAAARIADYLTSAKVGGRTVICTFAVYLSEKRWEKLPAKAEPVTRADDYAPPFGPTFMAFIIGRLLDGPENAAGSTLAEKWPSLDALYRKARAGLGYRFGERWHALKGSLVAVPVDTPLWIEWRDHFTRQGWPWLPDPGRVAYFPAGGPDGLEAFEIAMRGNHDAGRSEAAE